MARYEAIKTATTQMGCGSRFREIRWFVIERATGRPVRDVGSAKYDDVRVKAEAIAANMNAREAA